MVKTKKRSRKFEAKGGPKGMLEKGTITKKGKLRSKKRRIDAIGSQSDRDAIRKTKAETANKSKILAERKRDEADFVGDGENGNLGDLDMESFFSSVVDAVKEGEKRDGNDGDDDGDEDSVASDSSDENDGDGYDSNDEDVEEVEKQMQADMAKLAESDPDFHKYLEDNESSLLQFGDDGNDSELDDELDDELDEDDGAAMDGEEIEKAIQSLPRDEGPKELKDNTIIVNAKILQAYEKSAFTDHSMKGLKRIIAAYRSACHMADANDPDEDGAGRLKNVDATRRSYHIESSLVFDRLMVTCLNRCQEEFKYHLLGEGATSEFPEQDHEDNDDEQNSDDETETPKKHKLLDSEGNLHLNTPIDPRAFSKSTRWPPIKVCINSFLKATLHLLTESAKESQLMKFLLKSLAHYVPFLSAFPRYAKALLRRVVSLWSSTSNVDGADGGSYEKVRMESFLRMRQLALTQPFPFIETVLKSSYLAYAKAAKFANAAAAVSSVLSTVTFMGNCVVELYSLDYASSYQHAFVYVRQLALHLRTAMQKKTSESVRVVYCWQYLHCLKLWTAVLASACKSRGVTNASSDDQTSTPSSASSDNEAMLLKSLIYPLVEIIFGVARLIPTSRHLPLRLHCVRYVQQLAAFSESFIPTTTLLLESFDLKELSMAPKRANTKHNNSKGGGNAPAADVRGVRLPVVFKLPKVDALRTVEQLDACLAEIFTLLGREVDLYRYSAGFPEFTIRITQRLRKFSKETRNGKYRAYARGCIEQCEKYSQSAVAARSKLTQAPCDIPKLEILLPVNTSNMGQRYNAAIAKEKPFEVVAQPVSSHKNATAASQDKGKKDKQSEDDDAAVDDQVAKQNKANKKKKEKKKVVVNESDLKNTGALNQKDEVSEGINWSESESDSDSNSDDDNDKPQTVDDSMDDSD